MSFIKGALTNFPDTEDARVYGWVRYKDWHPNVISDKGLEWKNCRFEGKTISVKRLKARLFRTEKHISAWKGAKIYDDKGRILANNNVVHRFHTIYFEPCT